MRNKWILFFASFAMTSLSACSDSEPAKHCVDGDKRCESNAVEICADGTWKVDTQCEEASICNATSFICEANTCSPNNSKRCNGKNVDICTDGAWIVETSCEETETCNVASFICESNAVCEANATRCTNNAKLETCQNNAWTTSDCDAGQTCPVGASACENITCENGDTKCSTDGKLRSCFDHAWTISDCDTGQTCPSGKTACEAIVCTTDQQRCDSNNVEHCVDNAWTLKQACKDQVCDPTSFLCVVKHLPCANGQIQSACLCGGELLSSGYCCDDKHQPYSCDTTACNDGAVTASCLCGDDVVATGFCCSAKHQNNNCQTPTCDDGEVLSACLCGETSVSSGFCCRDKHQAGVCAYKIYYVSNSGGADTNTGTSSAAPWKSLDKVNATIFKPGDTILFKRGDAWAGSITIPASGTAGNPITYAAYGIGAKPKLYGSEVISGWTLHAGKIYKAPMPKNINQLFIDDKLATLARFPNQGYLDITTANNATQFTSTALNASVNYVGASWIGRNTSFTRIMKTITKQDGQTLTVDSEPAYDLRVKTGFILFDKMEFLDAPGEWHYDETSKTVYFWTPKGDSPANYEIRGSTFKLGFDMEKKNHLVIRDIEILHHADRGIYINQSSFVTVDNVDVINPAIAGIASYWWSKDSIITNNYVYQAGATGISLFNNSALVQNNEVVETGLMRNICRRCDVGVSPGQGIYVDLDSTKVAYNKVIDSGYIGIQFMHGPHHIHHNYINGACLELDDGGGIYTYNGYVAAEPATAGSVLDANIILNVYGNTEGKPASILEAYAIYLDNNIHHITVTNNTVKGANGAVLLNEPGYNVFDKNTFMDATLLINHQSQHAANTFTNNIMYLTSRLGNYNWWGKNATQRFVFQHNGGAGTYDHNSYHAHHGLNDIFPNLAGFDAWKTTTKQDANSTFDGTPMPEGYTERLFYNAGRSPKTFDLNKKTFKDIDGKTVTELTLAPFTSKILIGNDFTGVEDSLPTAGLRAKPFYEK